ncbi:hypothetical protein [Halovenus halobia]|uniref:hypothetical protein n=1 Tax=Halovenus halobia TaxID=3396622 RepID=UPI003F5582B2
MASATTSPLFGVLTDRLRDPRVLAGQALVFGVAVTLRQGRWVDPENPVLAVAVIPVFVFLSLVLLVDVLQRVALRVEEQTHEETDRRPEWRVITDRTLVLANTALVVPLLVWNQPIVGTLGYTAEALSALLPVAAVSSDHTVVSTVLVGGLVVGAAVMARGALAWIQVQFGPDLSTDRLEMYLALRASLPSEASQSIAPLQDGGQGRIGTAALASACVKYRLTRIVPEDLPAPFDIERLANEIAPVTASTPAKFVFLTTLNTRFLVVLFGSLAFIYSGAFGLYLPSIHPYTLWVGTGLGVASQAVYNHPFVSPSRDVLRL